MVDQNLQIVEVAFAIIAPWSRDDLFNVGMLSLGLPHSEMLDFDGGCLHKSFEAFTASSKCQKCGFSLNYATAGHQKDRATEAEVGVEWTDQNLESIS